MIIRQADFNTDALEIMDVVKDFISRQRSDFFPRTEKELIASVAQIVSFHDIRLTVAEHEGRIVGGLGIFYGIRIGIPDIFWITSTNAPKTTSFRLIREAMKDIKQKNTLIPFKMRLSRSDKLESIYKMIYPARTSWV